MRLVEFLPIEAIEVAKIVRAQLAALKRRDPFRNFSALLAHGKIIKRQPFICSLLC
jgi:hypothetical protein